LVITLVVFPLVYLVPLETPHLSVQPIVLLTVLPLGALLSATFGLMIGTMVEPRQIPLVFALMVMPLTFLGAVYYPWAELSAIRWLQVVTLVNPVVYLSEGLRGALTPQYGHMNYLAVYAGLIICCVGCAWGGVRMFEKRVLS